MILTELSRCILCWRCVSCGALFRQQPTTIKNETIEIYGTGKQSRCFCYVGDVVDALVTLMNSAKAPGRVYNIGAIEEISIEQLADKVISLTGSSSQKEYISYEQAYGRPFDDMMRRVPCLERINEIIGYEPKTSLEQTLKYIIEYIKCS